MIVLGFVVLGIGLGLRAARKRNGNRLDMLQYGAGYGIAFALMGMFVTIVVHRSII